MSSGAARGICGLGNMGHAIASRLVESGRVLGFDRGEEQRRRAAELGVEVVDSLEGLAAASTLVLSLPSPDISRSVVQDISPKLRAGTLIIETSTVLPSDVRALAEVARAHDLRLMDAAILSGVGQMREGRSTLLLGGLDEDIDLALPTLSALGSRHIRLGELGAGMAAKVVNNAVAHGVMVLLAEALAMAATSGIRLDQVADLLGGPEGGLVRPLTHRVVERVFEGDFEGGMPCAAARKDSVLALQMAAAEEVPLFVLPAAHTVYEIAVQQGLGRSDYAVIAQLWGEWLGVEMRP